MLDEHGSRHRIIPAEVRGRLRNWRVLLHAVLLIVLLVLPWLRINGLQALWLNLPARRFEIFGFLFLSHDAPLVFFILIILLLVLIFVTAVWGRVWCGWACPQTVFIDAVYRRIEIWIEGDYKKRRQLAARPMDAGKFFKLALKWTLYFIVSSAIAHSLMAYFAGAEPLLEMIRRPPGQNWTYFLFATAITGLLMFNFGWFREQFCIIMCPYGRLQSTMMDRRTVTILYDEKRGEPRKGQENGRKTGDCVSCNRCVEVCPVKIDIRNGIQMECISCTACIDACNEIMRKVGKPEGLIRNASLSRKESMFLRPRVAVYFALITLFSGLLIYSLVNRKSYSLMVVRAIEAPFQLMPGDLVMNHFKTHYMNQSTAVQEVEFALSPEDAARGLSLTQAVKVHRIESGASISPHIFVMIPKTLFASGPEMAFKIRVIDKLSGKQEEVEARAIGPDLVRADGP